MNKIVNGIGIVVASIALSGCLTSSRIGLISNGDLEGKTFEGVKQGPELTGESCGHTHSLSAAFSNAINGTEYDTMINSEVETRSGVFVFDNCLKISGYGVKSQELAIGK